MYDDISTLYDIVDICDTYILVKRDNLLRQVHIYRIEPVSVINTKNADINKILDVYTEFLRNVNVDFQIYIENSKMNINSYFDNIDIDYENTNKTKLAKMYKHEIYNYLIENNIYILNYYIVAEVSAESNITPLCSDINNLTKSGIYVEKLEGKETLNNFIYTKVNKVDNIC